MEQSKANAKTRPAQLIQPNWRFIRKIETLIFASMFLAIPLFAFRIVDIASTILMVQNTSVDLVQDVIHAREIAKDYKLTVTLASSTASKTEPAFYTIQSGAKTIEQFVLPKGVSLVGSVTFNENGVPLSPASFIISKGAKIASVEIDSQGQTSVH